MRQSCFRDILARDRKPGETRQKQAARLGFGEASLRDWEAGAIPRRGTLPPLARALHLPLSALREAVQRQAQGARKAERGVLS